MLLRMATLMLMERNTQGGVSELAGRSGRWRSAVVACASSAERRVRGAGAQGPSQGLEPPRQGSGLGWPGFEWIACSFRSG